MNRSQKLNLLAVLLMVGGLLLSIVGWFTVFNAVWVIAALMVGAGIGVAVRVEARDSRAAYEAARDVLEER